jgi:hypothetical protein
MPDNIGYDISPANHGLLDPAEEPYGGPMGNPKAQVWVTETALTTALNTSRRAPR